MIDNFYSYQKIAEFQKLISRTYDTTIVFENSKLHDSDKRPPFDIYTVIVPDYKHLGHTGKLRASFFNNRLESVWFYPDNLDEYLSRLDKELNINFKSEKETTNNYIRVYNAIDFQNNAYVGWIDTRLEKEKDIWISKYA